MPDPNVEAATATTATTTASTEEAQEQPTTTAVTEPPVSDEPTQDSATTDVTDTAEEKPEESENPREYFFSGQQVQLEVPEELKTSLSEAGVDLDGVLQELYGKDSDFTLSEETRKPLDEKYGKAVVDTFLGALKNQNENVIKGADAATKAAEAADKAALDWSNELVGGEGEWAALEAWAEKNFEDSQFESFNKAMQSGDKWIQELAIKSLHSKYKGAEGDTNVSLVTADSSTTSTAGAPLSARDYINEMTSPSFSALKGQDKQQAQAQLDARRRAGMKKGL